MDWTTELETRFALAQVDAGADMIGIGDAAASLVAPDYYATEVDPREKRIVDAIHRAGARVRLHICGDVHGKFRTMADTNADLIDIDFPQTLAEVRAHVGPDVCLAGNVHPVEILYRGTPDAVRQALQQCRDEAGERYILAAGCEIPPGTSDPNLRAMFDVALQSR
jgi:uroporphyrinogen-III decarboxylase